MHLSIFIIYGGYFYILLIIFTSSIYISKNKRENFTSKKVSKRNLLQGFYLAHIHILTLTWQIYRMIYKSPYMSRIRAYKGIAYICAITNNIITYIIILCQRNTHIKNTKSDGMK